MLNQEVLFLKTLNEKTSRLESTGFTKQIVQEEASKKEWALLF